MDISVFCDLLRSEMVKMGVPEDKTLKYMESLKKNLEPSDLAGVTEADIPKYAKVCADQVLGSSPKAKEAPTEVEPADSADPALEEDPTPAKETAPSEDPTPEAEPAVEDEYAIPEKAPEAEKPHKKNSRGTVMLILITAITSPLWLVATVLFFAPFIIMLAVEITIIAALVCLLAGCTAAGTAASLTGIVYGVVKMFTTPAIGLYEIGFGVIIAGVSMILGILIYNGAVRFMPWLVKKSAKLLPLAIGKVRPLLTKYRRWCEKL